MEVKPEAQVTFESTELGHLCSAVLRTIEGRALVNLLKDLCMYQSPWGAYNPIFGTPGEFLFIRQGQADLIRLIEQQARAYEEPKR